MDVNIKLVSIYTFTHIYIYINIIYIAVNMETMKDNKHTRLGPA